jgi:dTDP-4-dehydrorhamnose 3,5-epimerase
MHLTQTTLPGVVIIEPQVFEDNRGFFMETYHQRRYRECGIDAMFVQDNLSHSVKGILRGLHYQLHHPQGKLVLVVHGAIFDVAVDIRRGSPSFGQWTGLHLSADNPRQIFVPEGFAHGFCVLSATADVLYKCTDFYAPGDEGGILWSDPDINIDWPITEPLLSERDNNYPRLKDILKGHLPVYKNFP